MGWDVQQCGTTLGGRNVKYKTIFPFAMNEQNALSCLLLPSPHPSQKKMRQNKTKQIIYRESFPSLMIFNCSKKKKMVLSIMRCQIQKSHAAHL